MKLRTNCKLHTVLVDSDGRKGYPCKGEDRVAKQDNANEGTVIAWLSL